MNRVSSWFPLRVATLCACACVRRSPLLDALCQVALRLLRVCVRARREVVRGLAEEYNACATDEYGSWDGGEAARGRVGDDEDDDAVEDPRAPPRTGRITPTAAGAGTR